MNDGMRDSAFFVIEHEKLMATIENR